MKWEDSELSNEAMAEASVIWLLGWVLILPFVHPLRLLAYGLPCFLLLIALTILFPGASIFGPLLVSSHLALRPSGTLLPFSQPVAWMIFTLTALTAGFLLCVWQRDVLRRFRDPIGVLLVTSAAR